MTKEQCIRWTAIYFVLLQILNIYEFIKLGEIHIDGIDMTLFIPFILYALNDTVKAQQKED